MSFKEFVYKIPGLEWSYHFVLAFLGALIFGFPSKRITVIGVTGTKGKTTTVELINSILEAAGKKTAFISSVSVKVGEATEKNESGNSMPGRFFIQRFLARAAREGCEYALLEATSQGVRLSRHRFVYWNFGILTNLAPEHIEAHGSFEEYRDAKLAFLTSVLRNKGVVFINNGDPNCTFFFEVLRDQKIVVSYSADDAHVRNLLSRPSFLDEDKNPAPAFVLSDFNRENIAAAEALGRYLGLAENVIEAGIRNFKGVPGRMEFIRGGGITVVIDYAHTPESLDAVYGWLRKRLAEEGRESARLLCVLGAAGGGRDTWKRPRMGEIAARYCDGLVLTDEDSYDEDPQKIIGEIVAGIPAERQSVAYTVLDRREALRSAIASAHDGDVVIVTGKGSESWIHVARGQKIPWNERRVVEKLLDVPEKSPSTR